MSCAAPRELIHAYLDGELDIVRSVEMEEHLGECTTCSGAYEAQRRLRSELSVQELGFKAPRSLRKRIRKAVRIEAKGDGWSWAGGWRWLSAAVPVAALAVLVLFILPLLGRSAGDDRLIDEVVSGHVRSLMVEHLTDVASSDKHTVKPWFDGKLDFSPAVVDLADHGFPLVGGRLDYLKGRPVAALVYGRHKHFINLFVWPTAAGSAAGERTVSRHGFTLIHWSAGGMTYWAVSDLNPGELGEFAALVRERAAPPAATGR
jgi:anti-sigma factor RsiW